MLYLPESFAQDSVLDADVVPDLLIGELQQQVPVHSQLGEGETVLREAGPLHPGRHVRHRPQGNLQQHPVKL